MNLIHKLTIAVFILIGTLVITIGYLITAQVIPNPTSNHWFDAIIVILGLFITAIGFFMWEERND